jgi:hypothetical protein
MAVSEKRRGTRYLLAKKSRKKTFRKLRSKPKQISQAFAEMNEDLFLKVIQNAGYQAAQSGLSEMGFIVHIEEDFVVKQFPDGRTERIMLIEKASLPNPIYLD